MSKNKIRAIAFYLPQFYPTPENDEWWEPGFTEWTNVARAKPLFRGHYQPRIPRDLGFYDLRVPETREKQAALAREAGIEGFCYWHYWFGNGNRLLSEVFKEVVETGKPDFPFCLCWANHSWYQKTWDPTKPDKLLMEQTYPGVEDYTAHFMEMLPAFKDNRYMKTSDGRLIFGVFDPGAMTDPKLFMDTWNDLAKQQGLAGFYFFGFIQGESALKKMDATLWDNIVFDCVSEVNLRHLHKFWVRQRAHLIHLFVDMPYVINYSFYMDVCKDEFEKHPEFIPCINPNFDHSPRSSSRGIILHKETPTLWNKLVSDTCQHIAANDNEGILFIKAWNEWGEGNYLEPDRKWGKACIEETAKALGKFNK